MSYPTFVEPDSRGWNTTRWVEWSVEAGLYFNVRSSQTHVCEDCRGVVSIAPDGTPWRQCFRCRSDTSLTGIVPISYANRTRLEAAIWRAKNDGSHRWLNTALASILSEFLGQHLACVERRFGPTDIFTTIPSHSKTRGGWDHMRFMLEQVATWDQDWNHEVLVKQGLTSADDQRGAVDSTLFDVTAEVVNKRLIVVDDTFTTGGTIRSAAAALREAGARSVVAVTIGRQVNLSWDTAAPLVAQLDEQENDPATCLFHTVPPPFFDF